MKASEILTQAKALIATPESWTQLTGARNAEGRVVSCSSPEATCWCTAGAVILAARDANFAPAWNMLEEASLEVRGFASPVVLNDTLGHDDVMAMFDKAIELAQAEESHV